MFTEVFVQKKRKIVQGAATGIVKIASDRLKDMSMFELYGGL